MTTIEATEDHPVYKRVHQNDGGATPLFMVVVDEGWRESILCQDMYEWAAIWLVAKLQSRCFVSGAGSRWTLTTGSLNAAGAMTDMRRAAERRTERASYCGDCTFHHAPADCPQRWQRWAVRSVGRRFEDREVRRENERLRATLGRLYARLGWDENNVRTFEGGDDVKGDGNG